MWFAPLLRGRNWRQFWVAIRRAHRDVNAWDVIVPFVVLLFASVYWGILIVAGFMGVATDITFLVPAGIILVCFVSVFLAHKWNDHLEARATPPAVSPAFQKEIHTEAFLIAILLLRAASERIMEKELPAEVEIITRQSQREFLMRVGLWDDLPAAMKVLLLIPDGHWSQEQKACVESCWEYFSVLVSTLRVDDSLRPIEYGVRYDLRTARQVIRQFENWRPGDTLGPWDLRIHRDQTYSQLGRLWAEAAARGILNIYDLQRRELALDMKRKADTDGSSTDLLIDTQTVSELKDQEVSFMFRLAVFRWEILSFLIEWLSTGEHGGGLRSLWSRVLAAGIQNSE
jgi:hypothetical protein